MDIVLGVSMTPTTVRMVLVEGEKADGVTVDHDVFDISAVDGSATPSAAEQVVAAVLGTQESAAAGGHRLTSIGVAWSDHAEAAALREALAARGLDDVMLVSELHAAGALAQAVGRRVGYDTTALFFIERDTATMAVVQTDDGSVVKVLSRDLHNADAMATLTEMALTVDGQDSPPQGMFLIGSGVDISELKAHLDKLLRLPVHAPEESDLALCRGAALAAANAPTFEPSTVGLAYSQVPDGGPTVPASVYAAGFGADAATAGGHPYAAYAAFAGAQTQLASIGGAAPSPVPGEPPVDEDRKPFLLVGSALTSIFVVGVVALVVSLAVSIRPTVDQRPSPADSALAPGVAAPVQPETVPEALPSAQPVLPVQPPEPAETIPAPVPVVQEAPQAPAPQAPRTVFVERANPAPQAPAPAPAAPPPAPPPAAPAPAPVAPAPVPAPVVVPLAPQPSVVFWPRSQFPNWVPRPTYVPPRPTYTPPRPTWTPPAPTWTPPAPTWTPPRPTWTPPPPTYDPPAPTWTPPAPTWTPPAPTRAPSQGWPLPREGRGSNSDSGPGSDSDRSGPGSRGGSDSGSRGGGSRGGDGDIPFWPFG